jgi:hypothetical protein
MAVKRGEMSVVLTSVEMFAVIRMSEPGERTRWVDTALGLTPGEEKERTRDGMASLMIRGMAETSGEEAKFTGEVAGLATALSSIRRWLLLTAGRGDVMDNTHVLEGGDVTCLITPRAMATFRVDAYMQVDAADVVGSLSERHLEVDGKAALAVADGLADQQLLMAGRRDEAGRVLIGAEPSSVTAVSPSEVKETVRRLLTLPGAS